MALELNGTTGVSLVQDGVVTAADLASTLDLTGKTVTLPSGVGGKVLQIVRSSDRRTSQLGSSFASQTTVHSVTITPSSTSSKIILFTGLGTCGTNDTSTYFRLAWFRGATGLRGFNTYIGYAMPAGYNVPVSDVMYDAPSSTSSLTYSVEALRIGGSGTCTVNFNDGESPNAETELFALEIAG